MVTTICTVGEDRSTLSRVGRAAWHGSGIVYRCLCPPAFVLRFCTPWSSFANFRAYALVEWPLWNGALLFFGPQKKRPPYLPYPRQPALPSYRFRPCISSARSLRRFPKKTQRHAVPLRWVHVCVQEERRSSAPCKASGYLHLVGQTPPQRRKRPPPLAWAPVIKQPPRHDARTWSYHTYIHSSLHAVHILLLPAVKGPSRHHRLSCLRSCCSCLFAPSRASHRGTLLCDTPFFFLDLGRLVYQINILVATAARSFFFCTYFFFGGWTTVISFEGQKVCVFVLFDQASQEVESKSSCQEC